MVDRKMINLNVKLNEVQRSPISRYGFGDRYSHSASGPSLKVVRYYKKRD